MLAQAAFGLSWSGGSSQTITYTPGTSIGVVYIATDRTYVTGDTVSIVSGSTPTGISWAKYGSCNAGKLCTAFTGTASGTTTTTIVLRASAGGATDDVTVTFQPAFATSGTLSSTAVVGLAYSSSLTAVGGTAPLTWSVSSGTLPAGLSLAASTGVISGTPTTAGTSSVVLRATDSESRTANSASQTINVYAALSVTTASLADTTVGATFSSTLASSGGTTPRTWSISAGSLPAGLSLAASTGAITGTPTTAGTANFTARVACCSGAEGSRALSLTVNAAPAVTTASLAGAVTGSAYSQTLAASGGTGSKTWNVSSGSLPTGLSLSSAGAISGTPTATGTFNFTARVTDAVNVSATKALSIAVTSTPSVTTASLAEVTVGQSVSTTLAATGGTTPYTWSVSSGALPTGISLSGAGALTGTPTAAGTYGFSAKVTDAGSQEATRALSWTVNAAPSITTLSLPSGQPAVAYSQTLSATGGTGARTWSVSSGALPSGLALSAGGTISGTPSGTGTATFTLRVTDSVGVYANQELSLTIGSAPTVSTTSLAAVTVGQIVGTSLAVTGGTTPYTWSISAGALPAGISLNASSGALSGTPTTAGTASFTARVTDANSQSGTQGLSWTVNPAPSISTSSLAQTTLGATYSSSLAASGGTTPLAWSIASGALPAGLGINATTGTISGTSTAAGAASFTARVTDANGVHADAALSLTVNAAPSISTSTLPQGRKSTAYSQALAATGGTGSLSWSVSGGTLPPGTSLSAAGVLSGTPTTVGSYDFTARVVDSLAIAATRGVSVTIVESPTVTTTSLATVTVGQSVSTSLAASGGTTPYTWSISAGALPAGISLNASSGALSGTPTSAGTATLTAVVTDANSQSGTQGLSWTVNPAPSITTSSLAQTTVGATYSASLAATSGTTPLAWSIASGALPAGMGINATTGAISGTSTAAGAANFTARVTDANGVHADAALSLTVNAAPSISTSTLPQGRKSTTYSQALAATGGTGSLSWSVTGGTVPPGTSLSSAGVLSGTPTTIGSYNFTARVEDSLAIAATQGVSIAIVEAPTVTTTSLAAVTVGQNVSTSLAASGGTAPYSWSISAGALPAGISLTASSGALSGRPTAAVAASFTVTVTDANSTQGTQSLSWTVNAAPAVTTSSLPETTVNRPLAATTLSASGGTGTLSWSATGLPAGISLSPAGVLSGTPTAAATTTIAVKATDSNGVEGTASLSLKVNGAPTITTTSLSRAMRMVSYSKSLAAQGGTGSLAWSVASGALPAGLSLSSGGAISGTPSAAGTFAVTVQVTDQAGGQATQALSLDVSESLTVTTSGLSALTVGQDVSTALAASGGTTPYSWSVSAGSLPAGVSLEALSGRLSGKATTAQAAAPTVKVVDANGFEAQKALSWTVNAAPSIESATLAGATAGRPITSVNLTARGGTGALAWTASGLPASLTLSATGVLSGTPAASGNVTFTARATDTNQVAASGNFSFTVNPPPAVTTSSLPHGVTGHPYTTTLAASGGTEPRTWSTSQAPAGLALDPATGVLSGTPRARGPFTLGVRVSDAMDAASTVSLALDIVDPVTISMPDTEWPEATVGAAYQHTVSAVNGMAPYSWSIAGGSLPPGLDINSATGAIRGTPSGSGRFAFAVEVTDQDLLSDRRWFTLPVRDALSITTAPPGGLALGAAFTLRFAASGGTPPLTWSVASGSLPEGLNLDPSTGTVSGKPTALGTAQATLKVTDANNATSSRDYSFSVVSPLAITTASALAALTAGKADTRPVQASGGTPPLAWSVSGGALPAGLSLDPLTGTISGAASEAGTGNFELQVKDRDAAVAKRSFRLVVNPALNLEPKILAGLTAGTASRRAVPASGGTPPLEYRLASGGLPEGMSLDPLTGEVAGTPASAGSFSFTAYVADANGAEATRGYGITVNPPIQFASGAVPRAAILGAAVDHGFTVSGGTPPVSFALAGGDLPPNFVLNPTTGHLSGNAATAGTWKMTVLAKDANGAQASSNFEFRVISLLNWETPATLPGATVRKPYRLGLAASGGLAPYSYQLEGSLPEGLFLDSASGIIDGTAASAGDHSFTLTVSDAAGQLSTQAFSLHVSPAASFRVTPTELSFGGSSGGAATAPQSVEITSTPENLRVVVTPGTSWLRASFDSASTPAVLSVWALPRDLEPGQYTAEVTIQGDESKGVAVTLDVGAPAEPKLTADPGSLDFAAAAGSAAKQRTVLVKAVGPIGRVAVSVDPAAAAWLSVSPDSFEAVDGRSTELSVTVNPAALTADSYSGSVTIQSAEVSATLAVALKVDPQVDFDLSFSGLTFQAARGVAVAAQQVQVLNHTSAGLNWVASADSFLLVDPPYGTAAPSSSLSIGVDAASLSPGTYTGRLTVAAADGGPTRSADIRVEITSGAAAPKVSPSGLRFHQAAGDGPQWQTITIQNPSALPVTYVSSTTPLDGSGWLSYSPGAGSVSAGATAEISVGVSAASLPVGTHRAGITLEFSDGTVQVVDVVLSIDSAACQATRLVPLLTRTVQNFRAQVGNPEPVEVLVHDDCGRAVESASGLVSFSSGTEPALPLAAAGKGTFTATWTPKAAQSSVTLTVSVSDASGKLTGTVQATGSVVGATAAAAPATPRE